MSERKTPASEDERGAGTGRMLRPLVLASQLGVTMGLMTVITVLAALTLGAWVDRQLGTRPLVTFAFILVGVLVSMLGTINLAQSTVRDLNVAAARNEQPRSAYSARDLGRAFLLVLQLALVTLVPIGLGLGLGLWLDRTLASRPVFTVALVVISGTASLVAVFFVAGRADRRAGPNP